MGLSQDKRLEFHQKLINALGEGYKVYFQPPETLKMTYPCVVYSRRYIGALNADNVNYVYLRQYQVVLITRDQDDEAIDKLIDMPYSRMISDYIVDGLYHHTFEIYY